MSYFSGRIPPLAKATLTPLLSRAPATFVSRVNRDSAPRRQLASAMARQTPKTFDQVLLGFENVVISRRRGNSSRSAQVPVTANHLSSQVQKDSLIRRQLAEAKCEAGKSTFTQALTGFANVTVSRRGKSPKSADNSVKQTLREFDGRDKVEAGVVEVARPKRTLELIGLEVTLLLAGRRPFRSPKSDSPSNVKGKFLVFRD